MGNWANIGKYIYYIISMIASWFYWNERNPQENQLNENREHANGFPIFIIIALFHKQCKTANEKSRLGDDYATKKTAIADSQAFEYDAHIRRNLALFLLLEVEIIITEIRIKET